MTGYCAGFFDVYNFKHNIKHEKLVNTCVHKDIEKFKQFSNKNSHGGDFL